MIDRPARLALLPRPAAVSLTFGLALIINLLRGGAGRASWRRSPWSAWAADPAVSSSVFVTFTTDFMGFFVFLGLAALILLVSWRQACAGASTGRRRLCRFGTIGSHAVAHRVSRAAIELIKRFEGYPPKRRPSARRALDDRLWPHR